MNYRDRLARKAEKRAEWAESRARKATESFDKAHKATEGIPMGQPILVGHHSEGLHRNALARAQAAGFKGLKHHEMAEEHAYKAKLLARAVEKLDKALAEAPEDYQPGDHVTARYTNSHRTFEFDGEIIDRTLNFWKIRAIGESRCIVKVFPDDTGWDMDGRTMRIPCEGRKGHTKNNRIIGPAEDA